MAGRRIQDEADARSCLSAAQASGMSQLAWGQLHGIDGRSLNAWRMNLARPGRGEASEPVRFVELVAEPESCGSRYIVRLDDFEVEVGADFEGETLRRLLGCCRHAEPRPRYAGVRRNRTGRYAWLIRFACWGCAPTWTLSRWGR